MGKSIYEKIKESQGESPAKISSILVEQSKGIGKKFVNHSKALMQGYNETLDEDGASYGEDLASDGKDDPFDSVVEYSSPVKNAADEAAAAVANTTRVKREGEFKNVDGDALDVYDITTTTPGEVDDYDGSGGYMSDEDWTKFLETEQGQEYTKKHSPQEEKSVEMNVRPEEKVEKDPDEKAEYNMGWMESRNAKRARRVQHRDNKKKTRQMNRLIKKFERKGGNKDSENMPPEVRAAYAHFTKDGATSKFDTPIGSTTGVNKEGETRVTKGNEAGTEDAVTLDEKGNPVNYGSPTKFGAGFLGVAGKALASPTGKKVLKGAAGALGLGGIMYKQPGKSLPANFKDFGKRK
tara:strand:+ start:372 stop:1424 length:1053 start_codon:yes stop_codon:yes gene_type:complete